LGNFGDTWKVRGICLLCFIYCLVWILHKYDLVMYEYDSMPYTSLSLKLCMKLGIITHSFKL
jgi:hypothetical protein